MLPLRQAAELVGRSPSKPWIIRSVTGIEMQWEPETQSWKPYVGVELPPDLVIQERGTPPREAWPEPEQSRRRMALAHPIKKAVKRRDGFQCVWCRARGGLTVDHIEPWSKGGLDELENLQTLCFSCNNEKGDGPNVLSEGAKIRRALNEESAGIRRVIEGVGE